jgi:hypothetical protein
VLFQGGSTGSNPVGDTEHRSLSAPAGAREVEHCRPGTHWVHASRAHGGVEGTSDNIEPVAKDVRERSIVMTPLLCSSICRTTFTSAPLAMASLAAV